MSVFRLDVRADEEPGGEGVAIGTEDCAVVREAAEGIRRCRAGVEKPDAREPKETSGCVPEEMFEGSVAWDASAADIQAKRHSWPGPCVPLLCQSV